MVAPGATAEQRKKAEEEAKTALGGAMLGDSSDTDDNKSASLTQGIFRLFRHGWLAGEEEEEEEEEAGCGQKRGEA